MKQIEKNVIVVISTYNGEKNITRQLESILQQTGVNVSVYIRDDSSTDKTVEVVKAFIFKNGYHNVKIEVGKNMGYAKSFWTALKNCGDADYYAFSDQDDVWEKDKLLKCIAPMEKDKEVGSKLSYCKMNRCSPDLQRLSEQVNVLPPKRLSKKLVLTQTYNYGAATVINKEARNLVCRCWPEIDNLPHDLWVGLICYWFGKIYYVDEELYYWIRYQTSVTGAGTKWSGMRYRVKESLQGKSYPNVSQYLLSEYEDLLTKKDRVFLEMLSSYKRNIITRLKLFFDKDFRRDTLKGTAILKTGVLLGWL